MVKVDDIRVQRGGDEEPVEVKKKEGYENKEWGNPIEYLMTCIGNCMILCLPFHDDYFVKFKFCSKALLSVWETFGDFLCYVIGMVEVSTVH